MARSRCLLGRNIASVLLFSTLLLVACSGGSDSSGGGQQSVAVQSLQISGAIQFEDKEYGAYGFNGNTRFKPVRYAVIDLVDVYDRVVATTVSDEAGRYALAGSGADMRLRVLAQTGTAAGAVITIHDHSGNIYAVTDPLDAEQIAHDINISADSDVAGAFNMLDVFTSSSEFVSQLSNKLLPDLNAYWQIRSNSYGTYYCSSSYHSGSCPQGKGIYILGGRTGGGDSDHYDDDVLFHEYAHYIEGVVGAQDSPGGVHYLTENDQDLRLTWSEGLGGFFPVAVKTWMTQQRPELLSTADGLPPTHFVDTYGSTAGISIDMASPNTVFCPWGQDCYVYSTSEVAVVKILIGLMGEFGMQAIWDTYVNYMAEGTVLPASLETFWDGWMTQRSPGSEELTKVQTVFNERLVFYQHDHFEMDNSVGMYRKLSVCDGGTCDNETHYLYYDSFSGDRDLVAFDAVSGHNYIIETIDLSNGADTYIRILDAAGNQVYDINSLLMANDNRPDTIYCGMYDDPCRIHNDSEMLSSELNFVPATSGTYYVEVTTSSNRPAAAGRYGTYSLRITE
ncbi:hypothetical protein [Kaarinaea lacus]